MFLPSRDELRELWLYRAEMPLLNTEIYWGSSQFEDERFPGMFDDYAWAQNFDDVVPAGEALKDSIFGVRAIRAF